MRTSTSEGATWAISNARRPDSIPAVAVISGIWLIMSWSWQVAAPST